MKISVNRIAVFLVGFLILFTLASKTDIYKRLFYPQQYWAERVDILDKTILFTSRMALQNLADFRELTWKIGHGFIIDPQEAKIEFDATVKMNSSLMDTLKRLHTERDEAQQHLDILKKGN